MIFDMNCLSVSMSLCRLPIIVLVLLLCITRYERNFKYCLRELFCFFDISLQSRSVISVLATLLRDCSTSDFIFVFSDTELTPWK